MRGLSSTSGAGSTGRDESGFTLIETLTAFVILAVIGGSYLSVNLAVRKGRAEVERKSEFYLQSYEMGQQLLGYIQKDTEGELNQMLLAGTSPAELEEAGFELSSSSRQELPDWNIDAFSQLSGLFYICYLEISDERGNSLDFYYVYSPF